MVSFHISMDFLHIRFGCLCIYIVVLFCIYTLGYTHAANSTYSLLYLLWVSFTCIVVSFTIAIGLFYIYYGSLLQKCTDLDISLLYILVLGTHSKFARKTFWVLARRRNLIRFEVHITRSYFQFDFSFLVGFGYFGFLWVLGIF